jgi:hypothetical protein
VDQEDLFAPSDRQLAKSPAHQILARLPGPDEAAATAEALAGAGIPADEVFVLCGEEGARRLDPSGRHHGLKGRLVRLTQAITAYGDMIRDDASYLEAGGVLIIVPAHDGDERERAQRVLRHHGASAMRYFGEETWEELS